MPLNIPPFISATVSTHKRNNRFSTALRENELVLVSPFIFKISFEIALPVKKLFDWLFFE
jgi:hypothetical protein